MIKTYGNTQILVSQQTCNSLCFVLHVQWEEQEECNQLTTEITCTLYIDFGYWEPLQDIFGSLQNLPRMRQKETGLKIYIKQSIKVISFCLEYLILFILL